MLGRPFWIEPEFMKAWAGSCGGWGARGARRVAARSQERARRRRPKADWPRKLRRVMSIGKGIECPHTVHSFVTLGEPGGVSPRSFARNSGGLRHPARPI